MIKDEKKYLTIDERARIQEVCDLTKYYFMEQYLLSLDMFPEELVSKMANDMDFYFTDSNAAVLNRSYINAIRKNGYSDVISEEDDLIVSRTRFESFAKDLNMQLCMLVENGQNVVINSDTNKIFARLGIVNDFSHTVLDSCLKRQGIPNNTTVLDCCRISVERGEDGELKTTAQRILFPVEKEDETTKDVSEKIQDYMNKNGTLKFISIPLEDCYGKYLDKGGMGM